MALKGLRSLLTRAEGEGDALGARAPARRVIALEVKHLALVQLQHHVRCSPAGPTELGSVRDKHRGEVALRASPSSVAVEQTRNMRVLVILIQGVGEHEV